MVPAANPPTTPAATGTGTGNTRHRQGENDRRNRRDFHKPFHIDPSYKKFLSFMDPM
jgi:hypothetical protein